MSFLHRLPLSNFPPVLHHIQPGATTSKSLLSEPVGVLGQSPSLCNRINPIKPVEINGGANQRWLWVAGVRGPGIPPVVRGMMLEPAPTSGETWPSLGSGGRRTGDPRFGRSRALLAQLLHCQGSLSVRQVEESSCRWTGMGRPGWLIRLVSFSSNQKHVGLA